MVNPTDIQLLEKGGYKKGSEDYRWEIVQRGIGTFGMKVLNITFIAPLQTSYSLSLPCLRISLQRRRKPIHPVDLLRVLRFLIGRLLVWCLDFWHSRLSRMSNSGAFRPRNIGCSKSEVNGYKKQRKQRRKVGGTGGKPHLSKRFARGFRTDGLFKYSRHPNFLAEQAIWWAMYLFTIPSCGLVVNFALIGPISYTILFISSTLLTEHITANKVSSAGQSGDIENFRR